MSSFRKRHVQKPLAGTRTSPQTGQQIASSGNPSLDVILGGGLPIGSICLIEEDKYGTFSKVLAKYFLAEGMCVPEQAIFFGSLDDDPCELLHKLPKPLEDEEVEAENSMNQENNEAPKNGLRIAWRYNDLPPVNSEQNPRKIGHHFNLLEYISPYVVSFKNPVLWRGKYLPFKIKEEDSEYQRCFDIFDYTEQTPTSSTNIDSNTKDVEMESVPQPTDNAMEVSSSDDIQSTVNTPNSNADNDGNGSPQSELNSSSEAQKLNFSSGSSSDELKNILPPNMPPPPQPEMMPLIKIFNNDLYLKLLADLQCNVTQSDRFRNDSLERDLLRICITSLGSPLWYSEEFAQDILKFLTMLRATVRNSVAVCFITMPMHLVAKSDPSLVPKIRNLVDYAIELESFAGSERETNPIFKEYNGLLHLRKITAVDTLSAYKPETGDLGFKLRRKKFVIEKLHLPPELQEADTDAEAKLTMSCQSSGSAAVAGKASLDF